ncbi:hypothetical protein DYB25_000807 [Aphanomyces astaci]|uniref:Glycosyl transferase family 3 domain-containing protein n=2 Tax=Aphanomyces astaci TaxID=112090 RepID=A0A397BRW4_APHAT|nr:hypothetical protein DYB36_001024 [Aphanomyces astaci]RHY22696.1 hypothetical protein DYB25_000807 [Aphanomyces astaci]RHY57950.1 hypothetical protein DYB34_000221 [Aphanomyces astaci]RHY67522.1 hypothetical protein DYB38_003041 [Aphanomyces astaci]RHZ40761.1 hypothetical protein DYB31_003103 [Aphanomyces astaci]
MMGVEHALVVHCAGLDELNPIGDAEIVEVTQNGYRRYTLTPEELGIPRCTLQDLEGGDADDNCRILRQVFQGGEHCDNAIGNTIAYNAGAVQFYRSWRMISYNQDEFFTLLSKLQGSAFRGNGPRRALFMACFAMVVAIGNHMYSIAFIPSTMSVACTYTLNVFNVFLGLLVSFRLNSAFNQWRSGVVAMGSVGDAARGIVSSTVSFLDLREDGEDKLRFAGELRRLVCLYVSILVQDARGCAQEDLSSFIQGHLLDETEAEEMKRCGVVCNRERVQKGRGVSVAQANPYKLRSSMVEFGHRRNWFGMPQAAAVNGYVSTLVSLYSTIYTIANIPIPFNYAHFLVAVMTAYLTVYTFAIVHASSYITPFWVYGWGFVIFSADDVAREIECPFGTDHNDIDLENRIVRIEEELDVVLRSAYCHEASLRAPVLYSPKSMESTTSVCVDSLPFSEVSDHVVEETNPSLSFAPSEIPMPAGPMLRFMLTHSNSDKDFQAPLSDVEEGGVPAEEAPLVAASPKPGYGSSSSARNEVWL